MLLFWWHPSLRNRWWEINDHESDSYIIAWYRGSVSLFDVMCIGVMFELPFCYALFMCSKKIIKSRYLSSILYFNWRLFSPEFYCVSVCVWSVKRRLISCIHLSRRSINTKYVEKEHANERIFIKLNGLTLNNIDFILGLKEKVC